MSYLERGQRVDSSQSTDHPHAGQVWSHCVEAVNPPDGERSGRGRRSSAARRPSAGGAGALIP